MRHITSFLILAVIFSCDSNKTTSPQQKTGNFHLKLQLEFGEDRGQSLGTLFEMRDGDKVVMGAGFENSSNTYFSGNNRVLDFYILNGAEPEITSLGNPFPKAANNSHIFNWQNRLYAYNLRGVDNSLYFYDPEGKSWVADSSNPFNQNSDLMNIQFIDNKPLLFFRKGIEYNGKRIMNIQNDKLHAIGCYQNGKIISFERKKDRTTEYTIYSWVPTDSLVKELVRFADPSPSPEMDFPYAMLEYGSKTMIGTNYGAIYSLDKNSLDVEFIRKPGESWQPYCFLPFYERLLVGQYPSGEPFVYSETGLTPFDVSVEPPEWAPLRNREFQSIAYYGGRVFGGVWPWSEVFSYAPGNKEWAYHGRLMQQPEIPGGNWSFFRRIPLRKYLYYFYYKINNEDRYSWLKSSFNFLWELSLTQWLFDRIALMDEAPYVSNFMLHNGKFRNLWGQRITTLSKCGNHLYACTSNKGGASEEIDSLLIPEEVRGQYGSIYQITLPGNLSHSIYWKNQTEIEFILDDRKMILIQDKDTLATRILADSISVSIDPKTISIGEGMYGPSPVKIKYEVFD